MPALPVVPNVIRVELLYTNNSTTGTILNRLFFLYSGAAPTDGDMATFTSNVSGYWATHCAALLPTEAALTAVKAVDLSSDSAALGEYSTPVEGTRSGQDNSAQVAFLVTMGIARRYRGGKPKTFLPYGVAPDLENVGHWSTTFQTAVATGWNAFIAAVLADTSAATMVSQVNVSYYGPPNIPITNPVTGRTRTVSTVRTSPLKDDILTYTYETLVATQRRRTGRKR